MPFATKWKSFEREVAAAFQTSRRLMTGTIIHDVFAIDAKCRQTWQIDAWYQELKNQLPTDNPKIPVLVVKKDRGNTLVVIELSDFVKVIEEAGLLGFDGKVRQ